MHIYNSVAVRMSTYIFAIVPTFRIRMLQLYGFVSITATRKGLAKNLILLETHRVANEESLVIAVLDFQMGSILGFK